MDWESIDWENLKRLRGVYLDTASRKADYWRSATDLESYDLSFAARIGWKWDAVLEELAFRAWAPGPATVLDWGCGTGIASRRLLAHWGDRFTGEIVLWDRSPLARAFARRQIEREFPGARVREASEPPDRAEFLLISHVLNELGGAELQNLMFVARSAQALIWVEPGTHEVSRKLSEARQALIKAGGQVRGPCTHQDRCGMLEERNERHWCHSFARAPSGIFQDAGWMRFGKVMGIDLRSLPYSYLALEKTSGAQTESPDEGLTRVVGEARAYKGYSKVLACDKVHGVDEFVLQKRDDPALLKKLKDLDEPPFFRLRFDGQKIVSHE